MCGSKEHKANAPKERSSAIPIVNPEHARVASLNPASRRQPSGSSNLARTVSFPDDPVTMTQSPPKVDNSGATSEESTPQRGRSESRSASVPPAIRSADVSPLTIPNPGRGRSVKHLTCFWWKEKGTCKFADDECLYAHHDTGRYTEAPRQVNPEEPAKAGRNLARALSHLSLTGGPNAGILMGNQMRPNTPIGVGGYGSRPITPSLLARAHSPAPLQVPQEIIALQNELGFYKAMAATNQQEKNILIDMIHNLQADTAELKDHVAQLESEKAAALRDVEALKAVTIYQPRTVTNPYGPIGPIQPSNFGANTNNIAPQIASASAFDNSFTRRSNVGIIGPAPPTPSWRTAPRRDAPVVRTASPANTNPSDEEGETGAPVGNN